MEAAGGGDIRLRKIRSGVPTMGGPKIGIAGVLMAPLLVLARAFGL